MGQAGPAAGGGHAQPTRGRPHLFGWVDPLTGEHGVMQAMRGNTEAFLAPLQLLVERFQGEARGSVGGQCLLAQRPAGA